MKPISFALIGALFFSFAAQAGEPVLLSYEPATADNTPDVKVSDCTVHVARVVDGRNNRDTIGHEFSAIVATGVPEWASSAFDRLSAHGFKVVRTDAARPGGITIAPTLIRAYTFHGPMRINGVVAFDNQVTMPDGRTELRKLRAAGSKANMAGATSEYLTSMNYAINNAMDQLAASLVPLCKPGQASVSALR